MGVSSRPPGGYDKKTQVEDIGGVLDALKVDKVETSVPWLATPLPLFIPKVGQEGIDLHRHCRHGTQLRSSKEPAEWIGSVAKQFVKDSLSSTVSTVLRASHSLIGAKRTKRTRWLCRLVTPAV